MRERKWKEELSAYLDGEADDPAAVEERLRTDPQAAREFAQMRQISQALAKSRKPEVHPAFLTRVMACVSDEPVEQRPRRYLVGLPFAVAALLAIMTGVLLWNSVLRQDVEPRVAQEEVEGVRELAMLDPDLLTAEIQERIAAGSEIEFDDGVIYTLDEGQAEVFTDMPAPPDEEFWNELDRALLAEQDITVAVGSLQGTEEETFRELLREYATRG